MVIDLLKGAKLIDRSVKSQSDWDLSEGSLTDSGFMSFEIGEDTLDVDLEITVYGYEEYDPGDYWTPPYGSTEIEDIGINIESVYLNGDEISVSDDFKLELVKLIESKL
jgi:hypothetical protein